MYSGNGREWREREKRHQNTNWNSIEIGSESLSRAEKQKMNLNFLLANIDFCRTDKHLSLNKHEYRERNKKKTHRFLHCANAVLYWQGYVRIVR